MQQTKQQLRDAMRLKRAKLNEAERREATREICRRFFAEIPLEKGDVIAGYWPSGTEINIRLLLEMLEEEGYALCLPVVQGKEKPLLFRAYKRGMELAPHPNFAIEEPRPGTPELLPNVVIVPLLAFDAGGHRLGYGGGYYDRTLAFLQSTSEVNKRLLAVGVAFGFQQVAKLPVDVFDQRLDAIVTEKGVLLAA